MAKIRNITIETEGTSASSELHYIADGALFVVKPIPEKLLNGYEEKLSTVYLRGKSVPCTKGKTEEEAIEAFRDHLKMWATTERTETPVLLVEFSSEQPGAQSTERYYGGGYEVERRSLTFRWQKGRIVRIGDEETLYDARNHKMSGGWSRREWMQVEYSEEAEEFLKQIDEGFDKLIGLLDSYLGSKESIIEAIESGAKMLPPAPDGD